MLSEVSGKMDRAHRIRILLLKGFQHSPASIRTAVVHHNAFEVLVEVLGVDLRKQASYEWNSLVCRYYYGDFRDHRARVLRRVNDHVFPSN
jgi:hypothetical protein